MRAWILGLFIRFWNQKDGSIAPIAALALIPIITGVGAAVDYARANNFRADLQAALDAALLAGARDGTANWQNVASSFFNANLLSQARSGTAAMPTFSQSGGSTFTGSVSGTVPTSILGLVKVPNLVVSVSASAIASRADNSCVLTLDHGQPLTHVSLTLNGAPIVNLSGCSIRSNTSMDCNGHDGNVTFGIAAGTAVDCGQPISNALAVPDIYAGLADSISTQCGNYTPGVTWTLGAAPSGIGVISTINNGRTEYHICGDLTLGGSGTYVPSADTLIVIENGSLNIANLVTASIAKTAILLTGNNGYSSSINFPIGNGSSASLTLSPPLDATNPWQGVALFQDPKLTRNVDNKWGPGASFSADGLVYLGNSNVVTDGNTSSSNAQCSKFVTNSLVTNGKVDLNFDQSVASCTAIGLKQWGGIAVRLLR